MRFQKYMKIQEQNNADLGLTMNIKYAVDSKRDKYILILLCVYLQHFVVTCQIINPADGYLQNSQGCLGSLFDCVTFFKIQLHFLILFHINSNISIWNWSNCKDIYSALWILMAWCFSTRPSVATVMSMHPTYPCISSYLWVNTLRPEENGRHFTKDIFKCIFFNGEVCNFI